MRVLKRSVGGWERPGGHPKAWHSTMAEGPVRRSVADTGEAMSSSEPSVTCKNDENCLRTLATTFRPLLAH